MKCRVPRITTYGEEMQEKHIYTLQKYISIISPHQRRLIYYCCERYSNSFANPKLARLLLQECSLLLHKSTPKMSLSSCFNMLEWDPSAYLSESNPNDITLLSIQESQSASEMAIPEELVQHVSIVNSILSDSSLHWMSDPSRMKVFETELDALFTILNSTVLINAFLTIFHSPHWFLRFLLSIFPFLFQNLASFSFILILFPANLHCLSSTLCFNPASFLFYRWITRLLEN